MILALFLVGLALIALGLLLFWRAGPPDISDDCPSKQAARGGITEDDFDA